MATRMGFEPTTSSVTGWHSNHLNYRAIEWWALRDSRGLRVFGAIWGQKETQEISDRRVSAGIPAPWAPKATAAP